MRRLFTTAATPHHALQLRSAKFTLLFGLLLTTAYALLYSLTLLRPGPQVPALGRREPVPILES